MSIRDSVRDKIFNSQNAKRKRQAATLFGEEVDLVQPTLRVVQAINNSPEGRDNNIANMLIEHVYVRDSDEKVFDAEDYEWLCEVPFSADIAEAIDIINKMSDVDNARVEQGKS